MRSEKRVETALDILVDTGAAHEEGEVEIATSIWERVWQSAMKRFTVSVNSCDTRRGRAAVMVYAPSAVMSTESVVGGCGSAILHRQLEAIG